MIYFDNAATTPIDTEVLKSMLPYLENKYGNPSSIHALGRTSRAAIEKARKIIANNIKASVGEIFFTSGGTESCNMLLHACVHQHGVRHIISSCIEHHCVLHPIQYLQKTSGIQIHNVALTANGHVNLNDLEQKLAALAGKKVLVSLMHANNEIGNLLPLQQVAELCRQYQALFHSDTTQTFGYYPFDVQTTPIHFLTGSAHKLYGPKGVGFIYINSNYNITPYLLGGSQERNMRAGTENLYGIIGLGKATDMAYTNLQQDRRHISSLKEQMLQSLQSLYNEISFNGDAEGESHYKIINARFPASAHTDLLLLNLDIAGICASGGSACSSGVDVGSHVLEGIGTDETATNIRFSFGKYNTQQEVEEVVLQLKKILKL